jgi:hypothetical protein
MGVKVEGVRSDERVVVADSTARNRKLLIGAVVVVVVVVVAAFVATSALKGTPTYGPVGHQFQADFAGSATQAGAAQVGSFQATSGVSGVESWRYGTSSATQIIEIESIPANDPFLNYGADATNLLLQELTGSHAVTISGLPGVELLSTGGTGVGGISTAFPYTDTAVLLQGDTQYIVSASGDSQSSVQGFVHSFKTVG